MTLALQTSALVCRFGEFTVIDRLDLSVAQGARHAVIGPNGAGKTSLIHLLSGYLMPADGRIALMGHDITRLPAYERCRLGLGRTFQINRLFMDMTVLESVAMAVGEHRGLGTRWWKPLASDRQVLEAAAAILEDLRLVEIALALALRPQVLLLDEPAAGLSAHESRALFDVIAQLPEHITILLVEHDMELVFRFADTVSVLASGALIAQDAPQAIARHPQVRQVYLGHP